MRISIFGDSILEGVRLEHGKYTRDSGLQQRLQQETGVELVNRSRFGSTIARGAKSLQRSLDRGELGEYTILEFGGNDCDHNWAQVAASPETEHQCATPEGEFSRIYGQMIGQVRAAGSVPVVATLPPISARRYFSWISRGLDAQAILRWLGDVSRITWQQERFSTLARQAAEQCHCPVLDLRRMFPAEERQREDFLCEDGIHPNFQGQQLIFEDVSRFIALAQGA